LAWRKVVFIDDWGQEANLKSRENWAEGWFFRFVDYRIERGLPLIITTNLTAKDIARKEGDVRGDPLLRRLLEMSDVVKFA
jgi:DNA replication protein DnaC